MKPSTDVVVNRKTFVNSLKNNDLGLKQTTDGSLITGNGEVCALGYGCKLFEVDMTYYPQLSDNDEGHGPYEEIGAILGLEDDERRNPNRQDTFEFVWRLNDSKLMNFKEIGEHLEQVWGLENLITADMITEIRR